MDTVEITLPVSNKKVVLRNYTTRKDDDIAEAVLYDGVAADQVQGGEQKISFPIYNVMASQRAYIPLLVKKIDGEDVTQSMIDDLRSEDYAVLEKAVERIVEEHSPKAKEALKASASSTTKKQKRTRR